MTRRRELELAERHLAEALEALAILRLLHVRVIATDPATGDHAIALDRTLGELLPELLDPDGLPTGPTLSGIAARSPNVYIGRRRLV